MTDKNKEKQLHQEDDAIDAFLNKNDAHYVKPPSMFQMVKSFSKDLVTYIADGANNVNEEDYAQRLDACKVCPYLKPTHMRCGMCGCLIEHKARWKTASCPDKDVQRWKPQDMTKPSNEKE